MDRLMKAVNKESYQTELEFQKRSKTKVETITSGLFL